MALLPQSIQELNEIHNKIKPFINKTPVLQSDVLNELCGAELWFKCENFQKIGAFKARGAVNAVMNLSAEQKRNGVATHSSGNHAQALAYAAKLAGIKAYIVMPQNSPQVKVEGVKYLGGEVIFCDNNQQAREHMLEEVVQRTGAFFVPPYNHEWIIGGQGTAAKELMEEVPGLHYVLAPVGGGGLLSGTALAAHFINKEIKVIGCEPAQMDDAFRSFRTGTLQKNEAEATTVADGLRTTLGEITFACIRKYVSEMYTAEEHEITEAMRLIWTHLKITAESSSAVPLAVVLKNRHLFKDKKLGLIVSGGNTDFSKLPFL